MEWNYYNTFIKVAADCPVEHAVIPSMKSNGKTKPLIEYELAGAHPYRYTQEELLFEVHAAHKGISAEELAERGAELREAFYRKPQACMRASMLPKKYGWGIHFDAEGKLALVPMESAGYRDFVEGGRDGVKVLAAMRSSRK